MVFPLIKMPLLFVFQIGGDLFIKTIYQKMKPLCLIIWIFLICYKKRGIYNDR